MAFGDEKCGHSTLLLRSSWSRFHTPLISLCFHNTNMNFATGHSLLRLIWVTAKMMTNSATRVHTAPMSTSEIVKVVWWLLLLIAFYPKIFSLAAVFFFLLLLACFAPNGETCLAQDYLFDWLVITARGVNKQCLFVSEKNTRKTRKKSSLKEGTFLKSTVVSRETGWVAKSSTTTQKICFLLSTLIFSSILHLCRRSMPPFVSLTHMRMITRRFKLIIAVRCWSVWWGARVNAENNNQRFFCVESIITFTHKGATH